MVLKSLVRSVWRSFKFPVRVAQVLLTFRSIDRNAPFKGAIAEKGIYSSDVSFQCINELKSLLLKRRPCEDFDISFDASHATSLRELFDIIEPLVRDYLGEESYLDGINWMITKPSEQSISGSWHTDNVGNRLKCFVCVDGDGTMPTLIIPSDERVPSLSTVLKNTIMESFRFMGFQTTFSFESQVQAEHKTGSLYIFDTQLFHRGGYNVAAADRVIFHLEFSDRRKHKLISGRPIGTLSHNKFRLNHELLEISSFERLLDPNRLVRLNEDCYGYLPR